MTKLFIRLILIPATLLIFPLVVFASIGVGVNSGKIVVEEKLKPGMSYTVPPITVINTGDEPSNYETTISYHTDQPEMKPKQEWFTFDPQKFYLEPGQTQLVNITINLPLITEPGDYFAYLEAHPIATVQRGGTTLGVAAASKLYFTTIPANIFYSLYFKLLSFYNAHYPWPKRALVTIGVLIFIAIFKKFFKLQIKVNKPRSEDDKPEQKEIDLTPPVIN